MEKKEFKLPPDVHATIGPGKKSPKKNQAQEKSSKSKNALGELLEELDEVESGKKEPRKRPYFYLEDFGLIIPYWGIISVEKTYEWGKINGQTQMVFGLVINQGIESSPNMPFGERRTVYPNQAVRDSKFDAIVNAMEKHNYEFTRI